MFCAEGGEPRLREDKFLIIGSLSARPITACSFHSGSQGESGVTMHCLFQCNHELGSVVQHFQLQVLLKSFQFDLFSTTKMGPLQLAVTWYKIHHAGEQATHWDIQNKENANLS